jgi:hypothetical protein
MQRLSVRLVWLAAMALLVAALPARAMMVMAPAVPQLVVGADAVVVGKVTAIEDKTVSASAAPGVADKVEYHIATVKVEDALLGAKGLTHIKVGYVVPKEPPAPPPGGPIRLPIRRFPTVKLEVDQEALFFLHKHHDADFYVVPAYFDVMNKTIPNFDKSVELAKKCAKALSDPKAGLKAKDAGERALTAGLLVFRYRNQVAAGPNPKTEPIDAEESKLILKALADADWSAGFSRDTITPLMAFGQLGVTDKDGFKPPQFAPGQPVAPNAYQDAAKAWVKEHADNYRIQRIVPEKKDEKKKDK